MGRLAHVEIEILAGHHHRTVARRRGIEASLDALPAVDTGAAGQLPALDRLVPHGGTLAVGFENTGQPSQKVLFQRMSVGHSLARHEYPTVRTLLPLAHVDLVAADMEVLRREERRQLAQNIGQQPVVLLARSAPHRAVVVTGRRTQVGGIVAENLGMHAREVAAVPRQVELGDDLHVAHGGITDQVAHLVLRIEPAVFLVPFAVDGHHGRIAAAPGTDLGEFGMRLDLQPPPLVIRQEQMQLVDFQVREQVDMALHAIGVHPRANHVEHHAAVMEARRILDATGVDGQRQGGLPRINLRRQELQQGLEAVENASVVGPDDLHPLGRHGQPIGFVVHRPVEREPQRSPRRPGAVVEPLQGNVVGDVLRQRFQTRSIDDGNTRRKHELPVETGRLLRPRNQRPGRRTDGRAQRQHRKQDKEWS